MNRLSTHNIILILALLTLGTLGLICASIVDAITPRQTDASRSLLIISIIQTSLGIIVFVLQCDDIKKLVMPPKEKNQEKEKGNDPS